MSVSVVTPPACEPLSLSEAKSHLRVVVDDDNTLIRSLIQAARETLEVRTRRAFITRTLQDTRCGFPDDDCIVLPYAPLYGTTAPVVTYVDGAGVTQTFASSNYTVDAPTGPTARPGRIILNYQTIWPVTRDVDNAVTVQFVAGYGPTKEYVPEGLRQAMKILIGTWYAPARQSVVIGNIVSQIPNVVDGTIWDFRSN